MRRAPRKIESNFAEASPLHALPPARVVQIFCVAPTEVILQRYARRARHPGHLDGEIIEELRARLEIEEWKPLTLDGELIELDTRERVDIASLANRMRVNRGA
jgi:hypothetical protein